MSNHAGSAPTWITCTYLENMLRDALKDDSIRVHDFRIGPGSSVGDNFMCQIFRIVCDCTVGNEKTQKSIILKSVPKTDLADEMKKGFNLYETENKMMSETLPLLHEASGAKTEPFFPRLYKLDVEKDAIFMEDLKPEGYVLADKKKSLDLDDVLLVVKALAKLHASSYLLFRKRPDHKSKYLDYLFKKENRENMDMMKKMVAGHMTYLEKYLHLWPVGEEDRRIFRKLDLFDIILKSYERKESGFNALIHGDCWINNMMFKYENGKPVSVKLIDFQVANYNSIGLDLNYFLFSSAKEHVKLNHLEDVFQTYHDSFLEIAGDVHGFTVETIRKEFSERLGFGLHVALTFPPVLMSDRPFDLEAHLEGRESESNDKIYQNEKYISEAAKLLPLFKKHGVFS